MTTKQQIAELEQKILFKFKLLGRQKTIGTEILLNYELDSYLYQLRKLWRKQAMEGKGK